MSLISEALKEAQRKREKRNSFSSPPILPPPERKKKGRPFLGLTIFALILVIFSVYLYFQIDRIVKVRNRNIVKPVTSPVEIEPQKPPAEESRNDIVEKKEEIPENLTKNNKIIESIESEPKEKISLAQTFPSSEVPPPKKSEERNAKPKKIEEGIPLMEEERKAGQIEIIRSLISSKKSQMEEELLEIEKAERDKDWEKACSLWERVIEKNGEKEYFLNAGVAYKNAGNGKRAEELFLRALELDSQYLSALNNLGVLYLERNDYDKAIHYFGNALKISPGDPEIYVNIGIAFFKKNEFNKARNYFEEALKLNNKLYQSYFYLGVIYLNQNDREGALLNFTKLLEFAPDDFPTELKKWVKGKMDKLRIPNP